MNYDRFGMVWNAHDLTLKIAILESSQIRKCIRMAIAIQRQPVGYYCRVWFPG